MEDSIIITWNWFLTEAGIFHVTSIFCITDKEQNVNITLEIAHLLGDQITFQPCGKFISFSPNVVILSDQYTI